MKFEIKGEKIFLRSLKKSDAEAIYKQANDKIIFRHVSLPYPYSRKDSQEFILSAQKGLREQRSYELGICLSGSDKVLGVIGLRDVDRESMLSGELGYWLGREHWRQGITKEAMNLMLDFAFNDLSLHKVFARVMEPNIPSIKLLEKFGFKKEGHLRDYKKKNDKWMNFFYMGLLKKEFKKK